jgi:hypothetical protein
MRIDPETFLALTLLMGTGAAVGVAVMSGSDEPAAVEDVAEPVAQAPATESPAPPDEPAPATPATPPTATTPEAGTTTAAEEPWVDPFPIIPDDPNAVPGPDVEGF